MGRLLVADTHFYRVLVYSTEGELLFQIGDGVQGTTPGPVRLSDRRRDRPARATSTSPSTARTTASRSSRPRGSGSASGAATATSRASSCGPGPWRSTRTTGSTSPIAATTGSRSSTPRASSSASWGTRGDGPGRDVLSLRPGDRAGPLPVRLRVRQPPRPEVHPRRQAAGHLGPLGARARASCSTPGPWPSTARATSR